MAAATCRVNRREPRWTGAIEVVNGSTVISMSRIVSNITGHANRCSFSASNLAATANPTMPTPTPSA
jgi:hypothetical protein